MGKGARPCFGFPCACPIPVPPLWPQLGELVLPGLLSWVCLCSHRACSEQRVHLGLLFLLQLIPKQAKMCLLASFQPPPYFPWSNILGSRACLGLGPEGGLRAAFSARLWLVPGHWGYAVALTGWQVEGPFFSTQKPFGTCSIAQRGDWMNWPRLGLWHLLWGQEDPGCLPGHQELCPSWIPFLLQACSWMSLGRVKSCPALHPKAASEDQRGMWWLSCSPWQCWLFCWQGSAP